MHAIVLMILVFLSPVPAANGKPAVPAHAEVKAILAPSQDACMAAGQAIVSQLEQTPGVSAAGYTCGEFANPADKAV